METVFWTCGGSQLCATVDRKVSLLILGYHVALGINSCDPLHSQYLLFFWFVSNCCVFDLPPRHWFYIIWIELQNKSVCTCPGTWFLFPSYFVHCFLTTQTFLILKSNFYHGKKAWTTWIEISGEICVWQ